MPPHTGADGGVSDGAPTAGSGPKRDPSIEAGIFPTTLTPAQSGASDQLLQLLEDAATSPWQPRPTAAETDEKSFGPRLDERRSPNVILIDGGRGSGKTSLMLTILDKLQKEERYRSVGIRALDVADLLPLSPNTNLHLHVLGRLFRVADFLRQGARGEREVPQAPWHPGSDTDLERRRQELLRSVALGTTGNVAVRSATLGPEAFTHEVELAERKRIQIGSAFEQFMNELVQRSKACLGQMRSCNPFFVLPIDDADMNPHLSLALLELTRSLYHPRLMFVLTGDTDLFLTMLGNRMLGDLRRPLANVPVGRDGSELGFLADDRRIASNLAYAFYRKVIPQAHCLRLDPILPRERVTWLDDLGAVIPLDTVHAWPRPEAPVARRPPPEKEPAPPAGSGPETDPPEHAAPPRTLNSGLRLPLVGAALPERLRGLKDFAATASRMLKQCRSDPTPNVVAKWVVLHLWHEALRDAPILPSAEDALKPLVRIDPASGALMVDLSSLRFAHRTTRWASARSGAGPLASLNFSRTEVAQGPEFLHGPDGDDRPLPEQIGAAAVLAEWVAYDVLDSRALPPGRYPATLDSRFVRVALPHARWPVDPVGWPLPDWECSLDYLVFCDRWRRRLSEAKFAATEDLDWIALTFIEIVVRLGLERRRTDAVLEPATVLHPLEGPGRSLTPEARTSGARSHPPRDPFAALAEAAGELLGGPGDRGAAYAPAYSEWVRTRALLLAAPESGLSPVAANRWLALLLSAIRASGASPKACLLEARRLRRARMESALPRPTRNDARSSEKGVRTALSNEEKVEDILDGIDGAALDYEWLWTVEERSRSRPRAKRPRARKS
jgi:hypothetical protein